VSAVQSLQARACFPFGGLPEDLQRECLLSSGLQLDDVARAAAASKQLRGYYRERCAAEQNSLESAAIAAFGNQLVKLVSDWAACVVDGVPASLDLDKVVGSQELVVDLTRGDTLACVEDPRGKLIIRFIVPPWERSESPQQDPPWEVHLVTICSVRWVYIVDNRRTIHFASSIRIGFWQSEDQAFGKVTFFVSSDASSASLRVAGLVEMIGKSVGARMAAIRDSDAASRIPLSKLVRDMEISVLHGVLDEMVEDALKTLRMVGERIRSKLRESTF
jgi:hypothetical protein